MAKTYTVTRSFAAPLDVMWKAWSDAGQLGAWWGPKECVVKTERLEFRPGGFFHYSMQFPGAPKMWGRFMYREIVAPHRLVWLNSFSNEGCGITAAPFGEPFPLEMENTVSLTENAGHTTVTLHATPHGENDAERAIFEGMFDSLNQGFGGTFDQLGEHLAKMVN